MDKQEVIERRREQQRAYRKRKQVRETRIANVKLYGAIISYCLVLLGLMIMSDYPHSFSMATPHGRGAWFGLIWDSPVLLSGHRPWDVALFAWLWVPVAIAACFIAWFAFAAFQYAFRRGSRFHFFDDRNDRP